VGVASVRAWLDGVGVITDALARWLAALLAPILDALPDGAPLPLPSFAVVGSTLGAINALLPISGPLQAAVALLGAGVVFVAVRLVLVVWNLLWP
jgi:hypothetical protein